MILTLFKAQQQCFIFIAWLRFTQSFWTTCEAIGGENSNKGLLLTNLKWGRLNKTTYVANGYYDITDDFSNSYDIEIKTYYSSKGNKQLRLIKYGVPRTPLCNYIDGHYYRTVVQPDYEAHSNLPKSSPDELLCPLYKKGNYSFSNWPMDGEKFLPKYLNTGYYEIHMLYFRHEWDQIYSKRSYNIRLS